LAQAALTGMKNPCNELTTECNITTHSVARTGTAHVFGHNFSTKQTTVRSERDGLSMLQHCLEWYTV